MNTVVVPIGPGKGQEKPLIEALQSLVGVMRGHVRDLRDSGEIEEAEMLEQYVTAAALILEQIHYSGLYGIGIPKELQRLAKKYNLAIPQKQEKK